MRWAMTRRTWLIGLALPAATGAGAAATGALALRRRLPRVPARERHGGLGGARGDRRFDVAAVDLIAFLGHDRREVDAGLLGDLARQRRDLVLLSAGWQRPRLPRPRARPLPRSGPAIWPSPPSVARRCLARLEQVADQPFHWHLEGRGLLTNSRRQFQRASRSRPRSPGRPCRSPRRRSGRRPLSGRRLAYTTRRWCHTFIVRPELGHCQSEGHVQTPLEVVGPGHCPAPLGVALWGSRPRRPSSPGGCPPTCWARQE